MWLFAPLGALLILPVLIEAEPLIRSRGCATACGDRGRIWLDRLGRGIGRPGLFRRPPAALRHRTCRPTSRPRQVLVVGGQRRQALPAACPANGPAASCPTASGRAGWRRLRRSPAPAPAGRPIGLAASREGASRRIIGCGCRANGADSVGLIAPKDADIRAAGVDGSMRPFDRSAKKQKYYLTCFGRSCDGLIAEDRRWRATSRSRSTARRRAARTAAAAPAAARRTAAKRPAAISRPTRR